MDELKPGDRCVTKIGTTGTIREPPFEMPHHHFVELDSGITIWILRRILERSFDPHPQKSQKTRRKKC